MRMATQAKAFLRKHGFHKIRRSQVDPDGLQCMDWFNDTLFYRHPRSRLFVAYESDNVVIFFRKRVLLSFRFWTTEQYLRPLGFALRAVAEGPAGAVALTGIPGMEGLMEALLKDGI